MGAVTYPDAEVDRFIDDGFIPVQFNVVEDRTVTERFNAPWTPTIIIQDPEGKEHRRSEGYLDPKRFMGALALGRLVAAIPRHDYSQARKLAGDAERVTRGDPLREPEALYWAAVADYKASNKADDLWHGFD